MREPCFPNGFRHFVSLQDLTQNGLSALELPPEDAMRCVRLAQRTTGVGQRRSQMLGRVLVLFFPEPLRVDLRKEESDHRVANHASDELVDDRAQSGLSTDFFESAHGLVLCQHQMLGVSGHTPHGWCVNGFVRSAKPLIYAHRGASAKAPENTIRAFEVAIEEKADGVELDVRLAADGIVVVAHDPDLKRVAGRPGRVAALSSRELGALSPAIPTLDETLDLLLPSELRINVEIKPDVPSRLALTRAVAAIWERRRLPERVFISSFWPAILIGLRWMRCPAEQAFLFDAEHTGIWRAAMIERLLTLEGVHPHFPLCTPETVAAWRSRGRFVNAWTVDAPERALALAQMGVDGLITNDPAAVRKALETAEKA